MKTDLYDILIILPTPSFNHTIKTNTKPTAQQQQRRQHVIAMSDLGCRQPPHFKSTVISTRHNSADSTRFRIMWKLFHTKPSLFEAKKKGSNDLFNTASSLFTNLCYWLYEEENNQEDITRPSWQGLFTGSQRQRRTGLNQSSETDLLLMEEEQDAEELNNNAVFEAVAARASSDIQEEQFQEQNEAILRYIPRRARRGRRKRAKEWEYFA